MVGPLFRQTGSFGATKGKRSQARWGSFARTAGAWKRTLLLAVGALLVIAAPASAGKPVQTIGGGNALMTTINYTYDHANHCQNGNPNATVVNNCNIYDGKRYV